jgi:hypothetical protein
MQPWSRSALSQLGTCLAPNLLSTSRRRPSLSYRHSQNHRPPRKVAKAAPLHPHFIRPRPQRALPTRHFTFRAFWPDNPPFPTDAHWTCPSAAVPPVCHLHLRPGDHGPSIGQASIPSSLRVASIPDRRAPGLLSSQRSRDSTKSAHWAKTSIVQPQVDVFFTNLGCIHRARPDQGGLSPPDAIRGHVPNPF